MATSRDELAQMDFGYLKGSDLIQFAPIQLLTAQYDKYPEIFNQGCSMAYDEIVGELSARYDISKELSNSSQKLKLQTGAFTVTIAAKSYISRIILNWNQDQFAATTYPNENNPSPKVKIGRTLGGEEIFEESNIEFQKVVWVNDYFEEETIIYFNADGGYVDVDMAINTLTGELPEYPTHVYSTKPRNSLCVKIVTILAIRNILGSVAGENKILLNHFEWLNETMLKLKSRQMSMTLNSAPTSIASRATSISSSFKMLG